MKEYHIKVKSGMMIPRCPMIYNGHRCNGHMYVSMPLEKVARIRTGQREIIPAKFNCGCNAVDTLIIE
jgi:hypothetical protein